MHVLRTLAGQLRFETDSITFKGDINNAPFEEARPAYVTYMLLPNGYGVRLMTIDRPIAPFATAKYAMTRMDEEDFGNSKFEVLLFTKTPEGAIVSVSDKDIYTKVGNEPYSSLVWSCLSVQQIDQILIRLAALETHSSAEVEIDSEMSAMLKITAWKEMPTGLLVGPQVA